MLFSISAMHSLAILATADHEPTCADNGFTILCNSDIVLKDSFLLEQKSNRVFLKCLTVSSEESTDLNCFFDFLLKSILRVSTSIYKRF